MTAAEISMENVAWQLEHSVEAEVSAAFAWRWRTDIRNWHDPPARFQLDGPFVNGVWGTTIVEGQPPVRWQIRDVRAGAAFTIEAPLDGATLSCEWRFHAVADRRTRMTQRLVLWGDRADAYVDAVRSGFGSTLADGMRRIADDMTTAARLAPPAP
jgi:hypothetical protein